MSHIPSATRRPAPASLSLSELYEEEANSFLSQAKRIVSTITNRTPANERRLTVKRAAVLLADADISRFVAETLRERGL